MEKKKVACARCNGKGYLCPTCNGPLEHIHESWGEDAEGMGAGSAETVQWCAKCYPVAPYKKKTEGGFDIDKTRAVYHQFEDMWRGHTYSVDFDKRKECSCHPAH